MITNRGAAIGIHEFVTLPNKEKMRLVEAINEYFGSYHRYPIRAVHDEWLQSLGVGKMLSSADAAGQDDQFGSLRQMYWNIVSLTEPGRTRVRDSFFTRSDDLASTAPFVPL